MFSLVGCRDNTLAVGDLSTISEEQVDIELNPVASLNYLTKQQVLEMRSLQVRKHPQLLGEAYEPSKLIFAQIVDGKPWWGMRGAFIYGSGDRSIEGDSEESRFILNPFLLVAVSPGSCEIWDLKKLPEDEIATPDFPFCWMPSNLKVFPKRKEMEVTYDVSSFDGELEKRKQWMKQKDRDLLPVRDFGVIAYNARDFGYHYMYVPVVQSTNILDKNKEPAKKPFKVDQFIHCGGSNGYPGGGNNMSPEQPHMDRFQIKQLPATMKVLLWKQNPKDATTPPDMTASVYFK